MYEIYAQSYYITNIILEAGETVQCKPQLSEDKSVWELATNVTVDPDTGEDVQHLFIKSTYSGLDSTLIVVTDKGVYHLMIKSFRLPRR